MAEYGQPLRANHDGKGGVCRFVAICEDAQTEPDPEGWPSPLVVRIRIENSTMGTGTGRWMHANGDYVTGSVVPGENSEINIAPNRRVALYQFRAQLAWVAAS